MRKSLQRRRTITQHSVRTLHAEQNAIIQAATLWNLTGRLNIVLQMTPCRTCAMKIINAGIKRVVLRETLSMRDTDTIRVFQASGH
jgi:dCMP deaminase